MENRAKQSDLDAIEAIVDGIENGWNRGDAVQFSAQFAADGGFTNVMGMVYYGQESFKERHEAIFKGVYKGSKSRFAIAKLRFIRPDVAIADVDAEISEFSVLPPGIRAGADGVMRSKLQMVLVKEGDSWWITAFHNVGVTPLPSKP
jgi:uncharacterized protein (TIGR02246 family)